MEALPKQLPNSKEEMSANSEDIADGQFLPTKIKTKDCALYVENVVCCTDVHISNIVGDVVAFMRVIRAFLSQKLWLLCSYDLISLL